MSERQQSFWTSLPGILTGVAAIITAITGLYLATGRPDRTEPTKISEKRSEISFEAVLFDRSKNIGVAGSSHGEGFIGSPESSASSVEYDIPFPKAGRYGLEILYAAAESRPVEIRFNDEVLTEVGLRVITGGWGKENRHWQWRRVGAVNAREEVNTLKLSRKSVFPHIKTIKFVPID